MRRNLMMSLAAVLVAVTACSPAATPTTSTVATTTSSEPSTTTTPLTTTQPSSTTTTPPADQTVTVLLAPFSAMGPEWSEMFFPYGDEDDLLGTAPGGDGLMLGPEYGTQTPDGSWWFLDAAKTRIAHFADDGAYLDQVPVPPDLLVDGIYFQYQMPQALDDGSVVATGFRGEETMAMLRVADGVAAGSVFAAAVPWVTTDGTYLYGLGFEDANPYRLDPGSPEPEAIESLVARDGSLFEVVVDGSEIHVGLLDAGLTRTLQMRFSEDPTVEARAGIEVETGSDGSIMILMYGAPVTDESLGIGGFVVIDPDGVVAETEQIVDPFSLSDPGSPAHLGVRPGTPDPWIMVVGEDGVHVFSRSG